MIWPFYPFNRETQEILPILEIPPTLMDGGIFYDSPTQEEGVMKILYHIQHIISFEGAAVLDWHLEMSNDSLLHGAGKALSVCLDKWRGDTPIFWASPIEMAKWWKERKMKLFEEVF